MGIILFILVIVVATIIYLALKKKEFNETKHEPEKGGMSDTDDGGGDGS